MLVFTALKDRKYLILGVLFAVFIMGLYAFLQVLPQGLNNFWFWFSILTPVGWVLYLLYGIVFGLTLSFFIWQRNKKVYPVRKMARGGILGTLGSFLGVTAPVCTGCLPWVALLFPTSFISSLLKYNYLIMVMSIALLLFALWLLGGFSKYKPMHV